MKYIVGIAFLFLTFHSYAQQSPEWFARTNANLVQNYSFDRGYAVGIGAHLGYKPSMKVARKWRPVFLLGMETVPGCINPDNCNVFWYDYNFRFQGGFERIILDTGKEKLTIGLGASIFAGRLITGMFQSLENDGNVRSTYIKEFEASPSPQISLRYTNPAISSRLSFGYILDWVIINDVLLHGFSIDYRIK